MYSLRLTSEQLEMRDTVRDFVARELKPIVLHPDWLERADRRSLPTLLDKASRLGLRTLALSEEWGGSGADTLTSCIVAEELATGDPGIAIILGETSHLAHALFDLTMLPEQRASCLSSFLADDSYHLALIRSSATSGPNWNYPRPAVTEHATELAARKGAHGDWILSGGKKAVANAPLAKLFAVQVGDNSDAAGSAATKTFLLPRDTPGMKVEAAADSGWYHGWRGDIVFENCVVPDSSVLDEAASRTSLGRSGAPIAAAVNLGVGRAAYEAALEYSKLRIQGGRRIVEHQAIGVILAEIAIKLEVARDAIWKAAWTHDHPEAYDDRSISNLPHATIARVFTAEAMHQVTLRAAEVFGAMGVMKDMPMQQYVRDALIFLHADAGTSVAKFEIAEVLAGYQRRAVFSASGASRSAPQTKAHEPQELPTDN